MSLTSQMRKLTLTEPTSTLQMRGRVGLRFRPSLPARGHRAASLPLRRRASRAGEMVSHTPCYRGTTGTSQQPLWVMEMTEEMKSYPWCQETWV